jgi:hypothetical protein
VKVVLGGILLIGSGMAIAWTAGTRPVLQAVGVIDEKIARQVPIAEARGTLMPRQTP